ncbi:Rieske 2Fe-2S domain-containing protein [Polyangium jinanense]|uniref:Rieske 2Fe-2S domain-containing protein n=1 Tax=Polyangium jinanense TaxID=2829994 RepID=A0A9X4B0F4_9BACT|nr:Rieske 2Fe-2S domain-containing protein [Polyangium jinanense]MDC3962320.1 Rieske 2Fe-2S domain-containing protein [Polyangium jinanense]MDC3989107.1 Rieske 2Fe-2S domain-containing protein [Polyangium jinanense]
MAELDHWHPVLFADELGKKPAPVRVCDRELVLFRASDGKATLGALADVCPHRGMRLSEGRVEGGRLVCPYHGWSFAPDGEGKCPATPAARPSADAFDVVERYGLVWIKRRGAQAAFPTLDVSGYHLIGKTRQRAEAPLEVTLDNFIEVEHTPEVHALLGYPRERMAEVTCEVTSTETSVRVYNEGPQKALPRPLYTLLQIEPGDSFVDDWTTWFSPVSTVYDQYWLDPATGERRPNALRIAIFFVPVTAGQTDIFALSYALAAPWDRYGLNAFAYLLTRAFVVMELRRDVTLLGKLADKSPELRGKTLSRFDKPLGLARKRIETIYRSRG